MRNILGFEILPASFIISHLQISMLLVDLKCPPFQKNERPGIYLSNALTDWGDIADQQELDIPERFKLELQAARNVKQQSKIIVVIGNPPYNAFVGAVSFEEDNLSEDYKKGLNDEWGVDKNTLNDLYVRFFRVAEKYVVEKCKADKSVVCYISNFSYLSGPSFTVMRKSLLGNFDKMWVDCLNGDKYQTGKKTPDGHTDPSIFSTESSPGIQVGTAISLMVKKPVRNQEPKVLFRHLWGNQKKLTLLQSLEIEDFDSQYELVKSCQQNMYSLRPIKILENYLTWPTIREISGIDPLPGPIERRGNSLISFKNEKTKFRNIEAYLNPDINDQKIADLEPKFVKASGEFKGLSERQRLLGSVQFSTDKIIPYLFKPFDVRLAYLDIAIQPLFSRPSPELLTVSKIPDNRFIVTRDFAQKWNEGSVFYYSSSVCDYHCIAGESRHFPFLIDSRQILDNIQGQEGMFSGLKPNISVKIWNYLSKLGLGHLGNSELSELIWLHVLAVGHSPEYLRENEDAIRLLKWPRIPFPDLAENIQQSASLGKSVSLLLDLSQKAISEISDLEGIARICHVNGDNLPLDKNSGHYDVARIWGYLSRGAVMPGQGHIQPRDYQEATELITIKDLSRKTGLLQKDILNILGEKTIDVFLNDVTVIKNIPEKVWAYTIVGYQVIKKWLSYRSVAVIERSLSEDEMDEIISMSRRIASLLLLGPTLDKNYRQIKKNSNNFAT